MNALDLFVDAIKYMSAIVDVSVVSEFGIWIRASLLCSGCCVLPEDKSDARSSTAQIRVKNGQK